MLSLKEKLEKVIVNQVKISLKKNASNNVSLQNKNKTKTCCIVVVQNLALTLTIINIHEKTVTLQPLRMVKLIMLTGSFNCFIQSKQFSCNK